MMNMTSSSSNSDVESWLDLVAILLCTILIQAAAWILLLLVLLLRSLIGHVGNLLLGTSKHLLIGFQLLTCSSPLLIWTLVELLCHLPLDLRGLLLFFDPLALQLFDLLEGAGGL